MREVGAAVARRHGVESDSGRLERIRLECLDIRRGLDLLGRDLVPRLVEQRRGQVLGGGEAPVELLRRQHPLQQVGRHQLAGLVVDGVVLQHLQRLELFRSV